MLVPLHLCAAGALIVGVAESYRFHNCRTTVSDTFPIPPVLPSTTSSTSSVGAGEHHSQEANWMMEQNICSSLHAFENYLQNCETLSCPSRYKSHGCCFEGLPTVWSFTEGRIVAGQRSRPDPRRLGSCTFHVDFEHHTCRSNKPSTLHGAMLSGRPLHWVTDAATWRLP